MKIWTARDIRNLRQGGGRSWYAIENATDTSTKVTLYDEIGGWGVYASDFARDLGSISGPVDLHINSQGGEVFEGIAIYNTIRNRGGVTVHVDSLAASIASVIAMGGERVVMARNAQLMIHDASSVVGGDAASMREMADLLDKTSDNIADIYAQRAGGTAASWRKKMKATTWYSAEEAVNAGLADEISVGPVANAVDLSTITARNEPPVPVIEDREPEFTWDPDVFRRALKEAAQ